MTVLAKLGQVLTTEITAPAIFRKKNFTEDEYTLLDDMRKRRNVYKLSDRVSYSSKYLTDLIKQAVRCCSSAQNAQSARVVILMEDAHHRFWSMVRDIQNKYYLSMF